MCVYSISTCQQPRLQALSMNFYMWIYLLGGGTEYGDKRGAQAGSIYHVAPFSH